MTDSTMARLRAANPVAGERAENEELFTRITALPADATRRRRRSGTRRRGLVLALAVVVAVLVVSAAFGISDWLGGPPVKPPVTRDEYRAAQAHLTLPPGYAWPKLRVADDTVTSRGAGGGTAVAISQVAWECYWAAAIHREDAAGQELSRRTLTRLLERNVVVAPPGASENWSPPSRPSVPQEVYADDGGFDAKRAMYAQAARGDARGVAASCRANAPRW